MYLTLCETHVENILLIGKPIPILGCGPTPAFFSGSFSFEFWTIRFTGVGMSSHLPNCSPTVARTPSGLELTVRNAPKRESSIRAAFLMWENEKRSEGVLIGFWSA